MFELNFIAEPGIQYKNSDDCWSFLHKRKKLVSKDKTISSNEIKTKSYIKYYISVGLFSIFIFVYSIYVSLGPKVYTDRILNQVIDLIIESGYMDELNLEQVHFFSQNIEITIRSNQLNILQEFASGYRKEDKIPFEIFQKNNINYATLNLPWARVKKIEKIESLKLLASKTVFSNKITINYSRSKFELEGRSSDIISFLLQMAQNNLIQQFLLSIKQLDSGMVSLIIQEGSL